MWAIITYFFAGVDHPPATDESSPVGAGRPMLGYLAFLMRLAIVRPVPT